jgi:hydroxymethylpyrimidine/phosphomethylpyrimidine kinase
MTGPEARPPCVLSIAGSDSGGGAGIQADLKAFARCGVHGMTAVTAITAQSTVEVTAIEPVSPETIVAQVEAVAADIGVDAVKIGMLGSVTAVDAVLRALDSVPAAPVVLDPVMVAESGAPLSDEAARTALAERLIPRASVVTPNLAEARLLAGAAAARDGELSSVERDAGTFEELATLARAVHALGPRVTVVTGGHAVETSDAFFDGETLERLEGVRQAAGATHGSGCTHSSAVAAQLALGCSALEAARRAKALAEEAVANGLRSVGAGSGPVNALGGLVPVAGQPVGSGRAPL